ncbi:hypothetical protein ANN_25132 [Periplaneta americana]|uniref:Uncharacterized protein n=1 Tax=Periplaneta americana TaxID=6978 RepID=A0ABQ8S0H4_PERAM|nr:hypothetical protein ANN_25132 [Periplaneta americana]
MTNYTTYLDFIEPSLPKTTESYPAFTRIGLRENPGKNLNQVTCPDRDSKPGHLVSRPDALTVTPQSHAGVDTGSTEHWGAVRGIERRGETAACWAAGERGKVFYTKLANALRKLKYTIYEEVHGTADNGSNRQIDIIAISKSLSQGMIIDPTIRFETYKGQPEDIHEEKRAIYVPTIPYYKDKYQLHDISVTGLMFGARGTIPNFSSQF